ncbi:MAG: Hpt domain-containing protein [Gammaproteobacteria bacterium]|nr:Hpt domain-containing protein [Gammaproteobacteria bacterium]
MADYSALNWVKPEIDETLRQARHTLEAYVADPKDVMQMRFCIAHLHQVHGTLKMIEFYGAVLLAEEMELLARWLVEAETRQTDDVREVAYEILMRAILHLPNYLERLQKGHVDSPIVILPLLNELRAVRDLPLLSESMLFMPDPSVVPAPAASSPERAGEPTARRDARELAFKLRPIYQHTLLNWYRGRYAVESLHQLAVIVDELQQAASTDRVAQVWWVAGAFIETLVDADNDAGGAAKQLLGQIDREIKRLIDAGEQEFSAKPPTELLKSLLYYIGRTQSARARVNEVRQAFRLDVLLPCAQTIDAERAYLTGPNRELMRSVFTVLHEDISKVKEGVDIFVRNETQELSALLPLEEILRRVADTLGMLNLGAPRQLILEQMNVVAAIARGVVPPGEVALLEMAGALLQAESALTESDIVKAMADEASVADGIAEDAGCLPNAEYREMQDAVIREAQVDISRIKDSLAAFFGMPRQRDLLADIPRLLLQVGGGLSMLSLTRAVEVLQVCHDFIALELIGCEAVPKPQQLDALTEAISALEYYLEALGEGRAEREIIIEQALGCARRLVQPEMAGEDAAVSGGRQLQQGVTESVFLSAPARPLRMEEIDDEIMAVFLEEADEEVASIRSQVQIWKDDHEGQDALHTLRRSFHTLKGSGRLVGASELGAFAWSFENLLNRVIDNTVAATPGLITLVEEAASQLPGLVEEFKGNAASLGDIPGLVERARVLSQPNQAATMNTVMPAAQQVAAAGSVVTVSRPATYIEPVMDPVLLEIYSRETTAHLAALRAFISRCETDAACKVDEDLVRRFHTLHGSAAMARVSDIAALCDVMEEYVKVLRDTDTAFSGEALDALNRVCDAIQARVYALQSPGNMQPDSNALRMHITDLFVRARQQHGLQAGFAAPVVPVPEHVERDSDMAAVFMDEAKEALDASDAVLQQWIKQPVDRKLLEELRRELHTLKGGARMADVTEMSDLSHSLESLLTAMLERLILPSDAISALIQQAHDRLLAMLDRLRMGQPPAAAGDLIAQINETLHPAPAMPPVTAQGAHNSEPDAGFPVAMEEQPVEMEDGRAGTYAQREQIRVRSDMLDNLVGHAAELSILRSRIEQKITAFKFSLVEMEHTGTRLRDQLRRLEIETETQILFRYAESGRPHEQEFDPLELDRFTQMQQLSRSLLESVSDIASIQGLLQGLVSESEMLLMQQARVNTDLQESLLRTRMVQFSAVLPRLRRILRQTGEELGRQVELHVSGAENELDRTLLDRMVPGLEHMLRNAVGHGIEGREDRLAMGKPETGTISLRLVREGTHVAVSISDDGRGLDLEGVRTKAIERGLLSKHAQVTDSELMQFILEPGFSTAPEITQISGRGVGMDVVSSAIKQLGGTLSIRSERGAGSTFTMRLPLALSVSHVLMVQVGDDVYAVSLATVERVMRISHEELKQVYASEERTYRVSGQKYPFLHLGTMLHASHPQLPGPGGKATALLLRTGEKRIVIHVDGLIGSREIVVKSVGVQISTIRGITGATIMGDGRVVLVLDIAIMLDGSAMSSTVPSAAGEAGHEGITVMIVDDSITVRKVTTRLLERHNISVLAAKDGMDAITLLQQHVPDVMLLDIEMPRMDGYELAAHMRGDERLRDVPIMMITSRTGDKHRDRAFALGVNRYLGKPFQEIDLLNNIHALLAEHVEARH